MGYQNCYLPCESLADDIDGECGKSVNGAGVCSSITQTEQFNNCAGGWVRGTRVWRRALSPVTLPF